MPHNSPLLRNVVDILRQNALEKDRKFNKPILTKIDITRDLGGSFYAPGDWKAKHRQLAKELEFWFQDPFTDNGNSFDSCFQFRAPEKEGKFGMNIKIYLK